MTEPRERTDALSELLADAVTAESLESDLLIRFVKEPGSLDDRERERVETYLAAAPEHRLRLRVLTRFALSQDTSPAGEASDEATDSTVGEVVPISSHPRWRAHAAMGTGCFPELLSDCWVTQWVTT